MHKKTLEYKQNMHEKQKTFSDNLKEAEMKRKPFNAKINEMSMANANATRAKREGRNPGETLEFIIDGNQDQDYDFES